MASVNSVILNFRTALMMTTKLTYHRGCNHKMFCNSQLAKSTCKWILDCNMFESTCVVTLSHPLHKHLN